MDRCQHCQYYDRHPAGGHGGKSPNAGLCRRSAPSLSPINPKSYAIEGIWPTVRDEDWCGEFKAAMRRSETPRVDALVGTLTSVPGSSAPTTLPRFGTAAANPASIGSLRGGDD